MPRRIHCTNKGGGDPMEQQTGRTANAVPHNLILEGRRSLTVTGVRRVIRCDPDSAVLETADCLLNLSGAELSVTALDLERGEAKLSGRIDALEYAETRTPGGFLRRLVR